jgi:hypothetical protein
MQIIDGLIESDLAAECRQWLLSQNLVFGWKAHNDAPGVFWHRNFVLPGTHNHHYDPGAWQPERTFDAFVAHGGPLARVALRVKERFFPNAEITRLWVNVQAFGDEASLHRDFPPEFRDTASSVIWYPVAEWHSDWGGDFVVLNDLGEIEAAALVKPNRMVQINGCMSHAARPISRYCNALRIAVAFGAEVAK